MRYFSLTILFIILSTLSMVLTCTVSLAQTVSNVAASQEGNNIVVSYCIDKESPLVQLTVSTDGGKTFSAPLKEVSGDIQDVPSGQHQIIWDVISEFGSFSGNDVVFNVIASPLLDYVDLGLSVKWATCNLGANNPEEYGRYFFWGDIEGQARRGSSFSRGGFPYKDMKSKNKKVQSSKDAAHVILGGKWRMPTKAELQELISNCNSSWTNVNGVNGMLFTGKKAGFTDKSIFLPAAGNGSNNELRNINSIGQYWLSDSDAATGFINCLSFGSWGNVVTWEHFFWIGLPIRPVTK